MSKYCRNCGKEMNDTDNACANCGTKIETVSNNTTVVVNNTNTGSNGIAIAGFVCALLGVNLIGLILSIIGISNAKKCDGKNKGLAIAGVIISSIRIVLTIILIIIICLSVVPSTIDEARERINDEWENTTETIKEKTIEALLPEKKDGKAVVYFFRGDGCSHCDEATKWFDSIKNQYGKMFIVEDYETWYNEDNAALMNQVAKIRGEEDKVTGVPYIIVGDKSWVGFEQESYGPEIIEQINKLYDEDF